MAARCKGKLTHRVRERMRHRRFNELLNKVYNCVPGCISKAKKAYKIKMIASYILYLERVNDIMIEMNKHTKNDVSESHLTVELKIEGGMEEKMTDEHKVNSVIKGKQLLNNVKRNFANATISANEGQKDILQMKRNYIIEKVFSNVIDCRLPLPLNTHQIPVAKIFPYSCKLNMKIPSTIDAGSPSHESSHLSQNLQFHGLRL